MPSLIIEYDGKLEDKQIKYMFQRLITVLCGASNLVHFLIKDVIIELCRR